MREYFKPTINSVEIEALWAICSVSDPTTGATMTTGPGDPRDNAPRRVF